MNFGMFTDFHIGENRTQAEAFDESFAQIADAEAMGFDTVWLAEHHFSPERAVLASPMVIASAIAARTQRIRTGLAVQVLPLIHPLRIAEETATVDQLSEGRFELGVGRSGNVRAYDIMGIDYGESRERFQEAHDFIVKAWTTPGPSTSTSGNRSSTSSRRCSTSRRSCSARSFARSHPTRRSFSRSLRGGAACPPSRTPRSCPAGIFTTTSSSS